VDRTLRAALLAGLIGGGSIAFFGFFLGFTENGATGVVVTSLVVGLLGALLILAASRRADTFERPDGTSSPSDASDPTDRGA
jgi:hypothetical protein